MTLEDLANYKALLKTPLHTVYNGIHTDCLFVLTPSHPHYPPRLHTLHTTSPIRRSATPISPQPSLSLPNTTTIFFFFIFFESHSP